MSVRFVYAGAWTAHKSPTLLTSRIEWSTSVSSARLISLMVVTESRQQRVATCQTHRTTTLILPPPVIVSKLTRPKSVAPSV